MAGHSIKRIFMCAIIGTIIQNPTQENFDLLHRIFLESKIRGLHATGISYVKNDKIITEKYPVPADKFPFNFPEYINEDGYLYLIGHCRYSTSDLTYNQPISNYEVSVVHNGVITQELPETWKDLYGYNCVTHNDTELLLHTIEANKSPLIEWKNSSLAVCELYSDRKIRFYRNGKRPLFYSELENGFIITSTNDVSKRAGLASSIQITYNMYHNANKNFHIVKTLENTNNKDLQIGN